MKLWLLKPIENDDGHSHEAWRENPYGCTWSIVVRAETEADARAAAVDYTEQFSMGSMAYVWNDRALASCAELTAEGPAEVIIDDTGTG